MELNYALSSVRIGAGSCFDTTELDFHDFTYTWVINDFDNFKFYGGSRELRSPKFKVLNNGTLYPFQLQIQCGNEKGDNHLWAMCKPSSTAAYPFPMTTIPHQTMCIKYSIIDSSSKEIYVREILDKIREASTLYLPHKLANMSDVLTDSVLNNGNLTFICRMRFHNRTFQSQSEIDPNLLSVTPESSILDNLNTVLESKMLSDFKIIVGNEEFQVHKVILAARSPVFSSMFASPMKENQKNFVKIDDISPEIMKELLRFIYTDKVNTESLPIKELLFAADKYQIESLRTKCLELIMAELSVENVGEVLVTVDRCHIPKLQEYVLHFLTCKRTEIAANNNWKEMLSLLSKSMLMKLITILSE